jgi:3-methyladenine DNA glycosylase AlkD
MDEPRAQIGDVDAATAAAGELEARLRTLGRPDRAEGERRYLKSDLTHLGVSVPAIREVAAEVHHHRPDMARDELMLLLEALWDEPVHERRMLVAELLVLATNVLSAEDAPLLERLLRESRTWALVDPIAVNVVGALAQREPLAWDAILRRWSSDPHMWLRRASVLAHLKGLRGGAGDFERFAAIADSLLDEREFFIRKAIGWVLRETGKRRPDLVAEWLLPRAARAARITVHEAVKHLPERDRARILAKRSGSA